MPYANNPDYPYPELLPLLRVEHTPEEYRAICAQISFLPGKKEASHRAYDNFLTDHVYARCPLCQQVCHQPIDTYGFPSNDMRFKAAGPFYRDYPDAYPLPCKHMIGTHSVFHLHENSLPELGRPFGSPYGEVPYVTPWLLVSEPRSYAVLHALPICRIEEEQFVPRYTRFFMTYFSERPRELIQSIYKRESAGEGELPWLVNEAYSQVGYKSTPPSRDMDFIRNDPPREAYRERYDLEDWAAQGKLGWLDYESADLPLRIGRGRKIARLYHNILGRRYKFMWTGKDFR